MHSFSHKMEVMTVVVVTLSAHTVLADQTNIALQKPVSSSSVRFSGYPERGNDGDSNPNFDVRRCVYAVQTSPYPLPWWQIDLQTQHTVSTIAIKNRDRFEYRLGKFIVKMYNEDPTGNSAAPYKVCTEYEGTAGKSELLVLGCTPGTRGRFLRLQKTISEVLQFCEMEIYENIQTRDSQKSAFSRLLGQRFEGFYMEIINTTIGCARMCMETIPCSGFNMDVNPWRIEGTCRLFTAFSPVPDPEWNAYVM